MTEKVYLITNGEIYDYADAAVCKTKDVANTIIKHYNQTKMVVEEYELLDEKYIDLISKSKRYEVDMDANGKFEVCVYKDLTTTEETVYFIMKHFNKKDESTSIKLFVYCWADSEEQAVRIADEIRLRLIAHDEWKVTREGFMVKNDRC